MASCSIAAGLVQEQLLLGQLHGGLCGCWWEVLFVVGCLGSLCFALGLAVPAETHTLLNMHGGFLLHVRAGPHPCGPLPAQDL